MTSKEQSIKGQPSKEMASKEIAKAKDGQETDQGRRQFLTGLGMAAAAGAVSTTVSGVAQAESITVEEPEKASSGYRETDHIRDYYNTL